METSNKLPKEFKEKWLEALRSGDYKQIGSELCAGGKYCCIGVAGKVLGMRDSTLEANGTFDTDNDGKDWNGNFKYMKSKVPSSILGSIRSSETVATLTHMNDSEGKSFDEIADWIEDNL